MKNRKLMRIGFVRKLDFWVYDRPCINKKIIKIKCSFDEVNKLLNKK